MTQKKPNYQEQLEEYLSDWKRRVSDGKLYYIEDKQAAKVPYIPNEAQDFLNKNLHNFNVIPKARQLWFTTDIEIVWLDHCLFNSNISMWVIADTLENAYKIFEKKIKFPYDNLGWFDEKSPEFAVWREIKNRVKLVKNNESSLKFSNGSSIYCSTSFRSGTLQFLHISEFWKIAAKSPEKAKEIISGALEAVWEGGIIFIESTAEGKNEFFTIVKQAEKLQILGKKLNHLEPKLFFFPWWQNPKYKLVDPEMRISAKTKQYFQNLYKDHGIQVTESQAKWWQAKEERLEELMGREYPSYLDEAFEVIVMWAYFRKQLQKLQEDRRYTIFPVDESFPVYMVSDLGLRDAMDCGFFQIIGKEIRFVKWWRGNNMSFKDLHEAVLKDLPFKIKTIFFPHDGKKRSQNDGISTENFAKSLGYKVKTMRAMNINTSIDLAKDMFWRLWINASDSKQPLMVWGKPTWLTLIDVLSMFKEKMDKQHNIPLGTPEHNDASHTGDMIRYLFQAVVMIENQQARDFSHDSEQSYSPDFEDFVW